MSSELQTDMFYTVLLVIVVFNDVGKLTYLIR